ncbi:unnamed protein product [Penicillium viridicatum]
MPDIDANEIYGKELDKLPVWAKVEWKDNMLVAPPFFVKLTDECAYLITTTCQIKACCTTEKATAIKWQLKIGLNNFVVRERNQKTGLFTAWAGNNDPQATRYVVNFMHRTGLQEFQYVTPEDDDDEPTGLAAMYLGV